VAVLDTGIDLDHPEFSGRIVGGTNCFDPTLSADDDNGHGTHVAGTIAAALNGSGVAGLASSAVLVPVKIMDAYGTGSWSSVICGVDYVTANAATLGITVANMSIGGGGSSDNNCGNTDGDPLHMALCNSAAAGVTYTVAAMNSSSDTAYIVPAAYDDAVITVSALSDSDGKSGGLGSPTWAGPDDTFASFSNYGTAVDIGASGVDIDSTYFGGGYAVLSGTSMASPHAAAAAALYIKTHPGSTWIQVRNALIANGEALGAGHSDPSGLHTEKVLRSPGV
jgi:subtilisin